LAYVIAITRVYAGVAGLVILGALLLAILLGAPWLAVGFLCGVATGGLSLRYRDEVRSFASHAVEILTHGITADHLS
jgi:hypothetical protein